MVRKMGRLSIFHRIHSIRKIHGRWPTCNIIFSFYRWENSKINNQNRTFDMWLNMNINLNDLTLSIINLPISLLRMKIPSSVWNISLYQNLGPREKPVLNPNSSTVHIVMGHLIHDRCCLGNVKNLIKWFK